MAEAHHAIKVRSKCGIQGCSEMADRSISAKRLEKAEMNISESVGKRAHLCKKHYREFKKKTKKDRELESLGW